MENSLINSNRNENILIDISIDKEHISNKDVIQSMKDEISCSICIGVVIDPLTCSKCENNFCKVCINQWQKSNNKCPFRCSPLSFNPPTRLLKNMLSNLEIICPNDCGDIINYNKLKDHLMVCKVEKRQCPCCMSYVKKENIKFKEFIVSSNINKEKNELIEKNNFLALDVEELNKRITDITNKKDDISALYDVLIIEKKNLVEENERLKVLIEDMIANNHTINNNDNSNKNDYSNNEQIFNYEISIDNLEDHKIKKENDWYEVNNNNYKNKRNYKKDNENRGKGRGVGRGRGAFSGGLENNESREEMNSSNNENRRGRGNNRGGRGRFAINNNRNDEVNDINEDNDINYSYNNRNIREEGYRGNNRGGRGRYINNNERNNNDDGVNENKSKNDDNYKSNNIRGNRGGRCERGGRGRFIINNKRNDENEEDEEISKNDFHYINREILSNNFKRDKYNNYDNYNESDNENMNIYNDEDMININDASNKNSSIHRESNDNRKYKQENKRNNNRGGRGRFIVKRDSREEESNNSNQNNDIYESNKNNKNSRNAFEEEESMSSSNFNYYSGHKQNRNNNVSNNRGGRGRFAIPENRNISNIRRDNNVDDNINSVKNKKKKRKNSSSSEENYLNYNKNNNKSKYYTENKKSKNSENPFKVEISKVNFYDD